MNILDWKAIPKKSDVIFDTPPAEPIQILQQWLSESRDRQVLQPGAIALATADAAGRASNRIVQLIEIKNDSLIFATHVQSQKGKEIAMTGWASGLFYWRETNQQIILSGPIAKISQQGSDELWAKRSKDTYPMSVASRQSEILEDENELRLLAQQLALSPIPLTRPETWAGYALKPEIVEFYQGSGDRLHRRLRYEAKNHGWLSYRLQP